MMTLQKVEKKSDIRNEIIGLVYRTIDEINHDIEFDKRIIKSEETPLFGLSNNIDSLRLVNFILFLENSIYEHFKIKLELADEDALCQKPSLYSNVKTLTAYIENKIRTYLTD